MVGERLRHSRRSWRPADRSPARGPPTPVSASVSGLLPLVRPGCRATFIGHLPQDCRPQVAAASIFHKHRWDISLDQGRRPEHRQLLDLVLVANFDWTLGSAELREECHWHVYFSRHFKSGRRTLCHQSSERVPNGRHRSLQFMETLKAVASKKQRRRNISLSADAWLRRRPVHRNRCHDPGSGTTSAN